MPAYRVYRGLFSTAPQKHATSLYPILRSFSKTNYGSISIGN